MHPKLDKLLQQEAELLYDKQKGYKKDLKAIRQMRKRQIDRIVKERIEHYEEVDKISKPRVSHRNEE